MGRFRKGLLRLALLLGVLVVFLTGVYSRGGMSVEGLVLGKEAGIKHPTKRVSPPTVLIDDDGRIYLGWIEELDGRGALFVATSTDGGRSFPVRVRLDRTPEETPYSIHEAPRMAAGIKGELYVVWSARGEGGGRDVRVAASYNRGVSFTPSVKVNDTEPGSAGFEAIATGPDGTVYVSWLDGRLKDERGSGLYIASSTDRGRSFGKNVRIDDHACPCCRTALFVGHDGKLHVAWRKIYPQDVREVVLATSTDGGRSFSLPLVVGNDGWRFDGCPHRGPAIGAGPGGTLYIVWYAEGEGFPAIYLATGDEKGFSKKRLPVRGGFYPDHPVLTLGIDGVFVAWEEKTPVVSNIMLSVDGRRPVRLNTTTRRATGPSISVNSRGELAMAWSSHEVGHVRTVVMTGRKE